MSLFERHVQFVGALREAGLTVSIAEGLDAAQAVRVIDLFDREQLRAVYAATLVKRHLQRPVFDSVFDLYFPAVTGQSVSAEGPEGWRSARTGAYAARAVGGGGSVAADGSCAERAAPTTCGPATTSWRWRSLVMRWRRSAPSQAPSPVGPHGHG